MSVLQGVRIIELAEGVAGEYCGKLLADFGAEIIKVEKPRCGSPTRSMAPIIQGKDAKQQSGLFAYLNTNKHSVTLDLSSSIDIQCLRVLALGAAAIIDDHEQGWLESLGLSRDAFEVEFPNAIVCSITNFGQDAPIDRRVSRSLNVFNASGWGYHTPSPQDDEKPPLKGPGRFLTDYDAGLEGAICTMATLMRRERTGEGEYIDISQQSVLVSRADMFLGRMLANEIYAGDDRRAFEYSGPCGSYPCADGFVYLYVAYFHWPALVKLVGGADWTQSFADDWLVNASTENTDLFRIYFTEWLASKKKEPLCEESQKMGVPLVSVNDAADLAKSEQLKARGFFQELDHAILGRAVYPTVPYKLSLTPTCLKRSAPMLGEQNELYFDGVSAISVPKAAKREWEAPLMHRKTFGPLEGVRVLAITKAWAGPYAGKQLALLGAEVIRVESHINLDEMRSYQTDDINLGPIFNSINQEVLSVQVNTKTAEGLRNLREMVARSDVVIDNIRPGALKKMKLGYDDLRAIKKDIIYASFKMNGDSGPLSYQTGYAPCFAALGGINSLVGYEEESPRGMNQSYGDSTGGAALTFAVLAALMHKERTGEGQFVDVSATECMTSMIGDVLFEFGLTGKVPRHDGNRHADMCPHGVYPCKALTWISIAIDSDQAWFELCKTLGIVDMQQDPRFASMPKRQQHRIEIDERLCTSTAKHHAASLASQLRQAGVAAYKSQTSLDVISDEHLWQRKTFTTVRSATGKRRPMVSSGWRFSRRQTRPTHGAPTLGEHNTYVYCELLGMSREELQKMIDQRIVY